MVLRTHAVCVMVVLIGVLVPPHRTQSDFQNCGGDRYAGLPFSKRSAVIAPNGAAASSHPLVSSVMVDILKKGGTAIDAAIAGNALQGVVEPNMNGIGGDLFAQVWDPVTKKLYGLNGSGRSSKFTSLHQMRRLVGYPKVKFIPEYSPLAVSVPGCVDAWFELHERFGKLPMKDLLQPAITYAEEGNPVAEVIANDWALQLSIFLEDETHKDLTLDGKFPENFDEFRRVFLTDGKKPPSAGFLFKNPDLAQTLRRIAEGGRDEFYRGSIARDLHRWFQATGITLRYVDLALHSSTWVEPFSTSYRGYDVHELPPNTQGFAALIMLNILEGFNLTEFGHNSADYLHAHIEAKKLAFADRAAYFADADTNDLNYSLLLDKAYAAERRELIDFEHAALEVEAGDPFTRSPEGDTVYITVADKNGMMVSLIQSNYEMFGSGLVAKDMGFPIQNRGALFSLNRKSYDVFAPHKRPFHTIIPAFITRDGEPLMSFGVMGGAIQPQGHVQIVCNLIDFGMTVQEAGDAARYVHDRDSDPTGFVMRDGGIVSLESGVSPDAVQELQRRGHALGPAGVFHFGGYQAIWRDRINNVYWAASEFRKDGQAEGY